MEQLVLDINETAQHAPPAASPANSDDIPALLLLPPETEPVPHDVLTAVEDAQLVVARPRWTETDLKAAFDQRIVVLRTGGVGIELRTLFALFVAVLLNAVCLLGIYYASVYEWRWLGGGHGGSTGLGLALGTTGNGGVLMVGDAGLSGDLASPGTGSPEIRPFIPTPSSPPHPDLLTDKTANTDLLQTGDKLLGDTPLIALGGGMTPQQWATPKPARPAPQGPVIAAPTIQPTPAPVGPVIVGPKEHVAGTPGPAVAVIGTGNGARGKGHAKLGGEDAGSGDEGEPVIDLMKPGVGGSGGGGPGNGRNRGASGANSDQPVPLDMPAPIIPLELQAIAYKSRVTFEIQVLANGSVGTIKLLKGSGSSDLDGLYRATVTRFKFLAPTKAGRRVEGIFIYSYIGPGAPDRDTAGGLGGGGEGGG